MALTMKRPAKRWSAGEPDNRSGHREAAHEDCYTRGMGASSVGVATKQAGRP